MKRRPMLFVLCMLTSAQQALSAQYDFSFEHSDLSSGYATWNDFGVITRFNQDTPNPWILETALKQHFNEQSGVAALAHTESYTELWYQDFSAQAATNALITPQWGLFTEIHRKILPDSSLVPGLGFGFSKNASPYSDLYTVLEASYYAAAGVVLQGGSRMNWSNPGSVTALRFFLAADLNPIEKLRITLKVDTGQEGYQLLGEQRTVNQFRSTTMRLGLQHQFTPTLGFGPMLELYQSPPYRRTTVGLGLTLSP